MTAPGSATAFALREMGSSSILFGHVHLNLLRRSVLVSFVGTKVGDAHVEEVSQGCAEPSAPSLCSPSSYCPFCMMARHLEALKIPFATLGFPLDSWHERPLFPNDSGSVVKEFPWLESARKLIKASGDLVIDDPFVCKTQVPCV